MLTIAEIERHQTMAGRTGNHEAVCSDHRHLHGQIANNVGLAGQPSQVEVRRVCFIGLAQQQKRLIDSLQDADREVIE
jgi:hypothetical protein